MKKLIYILISIILSILYGTIWFANNGKFLYNDIDYGTSSTKTALGIWNSSSAWEQIAKKFLKDATKQKHPITFYVARAVNYFLGILAFWTFLVIVWWFSMVFTQKTDEWLKKGFKFMKIWIIVIIVIWVSWLISMGIFHIYNSWVN